MAVAVLRVREGGEAADDFARDDAAPPVRAFLAAGAVTSAALLEFFGVLAIVLVVV